MDEQLAFVICPPRSGSTLLSRLLASHSAIYCRPEPHLIPTVHQMGYYGSVVDPGKKDGLTAYHPEITRSAMNSIVAELPRGEDDYLDALRAYLNTIYGRLLAAAGKQVFVDKTPGNAHYIDFILKLYPRARFIVVTRNPIAVLLSLRALIPTMPGFVAEATPASYLSKAEKIALITLPKRVKAVGEFLRSRRVPLHHLRFEDFVTAPERIAGICSYLGLPFEPTMLDYGETSRAWVGPGDPMSVARHQKPEGDYADKWRSELREHPERLPFVRRALKDMAAEDLEAWGYSAAALEADLAAIAP